MVYGEEWKQFSGLNTAEMGRQGALFRDKYEEIVSRRNVQEMIGDFTDLVKLLYYDGENSSCLLKFLYKLRISKI